MLVHKKLQNTTERRELSERRNMLAEKINEYLNKWRDISWS